MNRLFCQQIRFKTIRANAPKQPSLNQKSPVLLGEEGFRMIDKDSSSFFVKRISKSGYLPVYRQYKNGKSRQITVIKRIEGNLMDLKSELAAFIPGERIAIKEAAQKIAINGDYAAIVRDWLTRNKF